MTEREVVVLRDPQGFPGEETDERVGSLTSKRLSRGGVAAQVLLTMMRLRKSAYTVPIVTEFGS